MLYVPSWEELPHVAVWDMPSFTPQPNRPLQSTPIAGSARWMLKPEQGQRTMETVVSPAKLSTDYLLPSPPTPCQDYRLKRKKKRKTNKQPEKNKWTTTAKTTAFPLLFLQVNESSQARESIIQLEHEPQQRPRRSEATCSRKKRLHTGCKIKLECYYTWSTCTSPYTGAEHKVHSQACCYVLWSRQAVNNVHRMIWRTHN